MNRLVLVGSLLVAVASAAAEPSWSDRAREAEAVVVGRCESTESRWEDGSIYSYSKVSTRQGPPADLVVRQRGGVVDGIGQKVSHVVLLRPGDSYLLFLESDPGEEPWRAIAGGVLPIERSLSGVERIAGEPLENVLRAIGGLR